MCTIAQLNEEASYWQRPFSQMELNLIWHLGCTWIQEIMTRIGNTSDDTIYVE